MQTSTGQNHVQWPRHACSLAGKDFYSFYSRDLENFLQCYVRLITRTKSMPPHGLMRLKDSGPPKAPRAGVRAGQPTPRTHSLPAVCVQELSDLSGSVSLLSKGHSDITNLARLPQHPVS